MRWSELKIFSLFEPKAARERRHVWDKLDNYPIYSPPFRSRRTNRQKAEENFRYFQETKRDRISLLSKFLSNFACDIFSPHDPIRQLGDWLFQYSGHFLPRRYLEGEIESLCYYDPPWVHDMLGFNVIMDIGTFLGNFVVQNNAHTKWNLYTGYDRMHGQKPLNFNHPCIFNLTVLTSTMPFDPVYEIYNIAEAVRYRTQGNPSVFSPWNEIIYFSSYVKTLTTYDKNFPEGDRKAQNGLIDYSYEESDDDA